MKGNKGFTLVELIIVIVILGILGAMIIPRFAAFDTKARTSTVIALEGAIHSASAIAHAQSIAEGSTASSSSTISMDGVTVNLVYGYPTAAGIASSLASYSGFSSEVSGSINTFTKEDTTSTSCKVTYTAPTTAGSGPTIVALTTCT